MAVNCFSSLGARAQVRELLGAHAAPPAELLHHDRPAEDELVAAVVAKGDGPAAELVEAVHGVHEVPEERVPAQLTVAHHVEAGGLLEGDGLVHRTILHALELGRSEAARGEGGARVDEVRGTQKASHDVAANRHAAESTLRGGQQLTAMGRQGPKQLTAM